MTTHLIARRSLVAPKSVAKGGALVRSMGLTAAALEDLETTCRKTFDDGGMQATL